MKLLFDQNLPPKLVNRLADLFPDFTHVQVSGPEPVDDQTLHDILPWPPEDRDFRGLLLCMPRPTAHPADMMEGSTPSWRNCSKRVAIEAPLRWTCSNVPDMMNRGGAWDSNTKWVDCAFRNVNLKLNRSNNIGFRCART